MKRFYKSATAAARDDGGAQVLLDGRPLRTPARAEMILPTLALAGAVAAEWDAQQGEIVPQRMPLTRLAATAIDRVTVDPAPAIADIVRYCGTDLLSYRTEAPAELVASQQRTWSPLLDWFRERYDIQLLVTVGVIAVPQAADLPQRIERICAGLDAMRLTALHAATTITGSAVLGLAVLEGRLTAAEAHEASQLDELFQARQWGEDEEARMRRDALHEELAAVERFLLLLRAEKQH
jgi:chaperone required for assembly of F1-ATPase